MIPNVYVTVLVVKGLGTDFNKFIAFQNKGNLDSKKALINSQIKKLESEIKDLGSSTPISNRNQILISKKKIELDNLKNDLNSVTDSLAKTKSSFVEGAMDYNLIKPDFKLGVVNLSVSKRDREILIDLKPSKKSYKVGEEVEIEIRTKDYQNRPVQSVVSLAVVDESLLALKANKKVSPLDYFYGPRALQVSTSASLSIHVDRINVAAKGGAKGGGGGIDDKFNKKRGTFKDTAYFNPLIKTDGGGVAKIKFLPPDNLTTWEMWAVASSGTNKFGMQKEDFVVKKPIAITSILPRFVISGDQLTIGALVHNQSGVDTKTRVELKADGFDIKGSSKRSISIKNGESTKVNWNVTVKKVNVNSTLTVEFSSPRDTVQYKIPASPLSFPEVVSVNGTVKDKYSEAVKIPSTLLRDMGGLNLKVGGSLLTKFVKQFQLLKDYPYGCAEQITSKILPLLVLEYQSSKQKDADLFKLLNLNKEKNEKIVKDTLQKLSKFQRFNGGYGFWVGSTKGYPMLTSYILYAQHLATKSGYIVGDNNFNIATQYLWKSLNDKSTSTLSLDDRAFVLWVLSEIGKNDTGMTLKLYEKRSGLSLYAKALMLMNLENLYNNGQSSVRSFITKLKAEIVSKQIMHERTIHFEEQSTSPWDLNTDRRTTAMVLMALNRNNPDNPILPNIVNYLSTSKTKRHFINSQETAWMLMSILEYADSQNILTADFTFDTKLNTKSVLAGKITKSNLSQIFEKMIPLKDLRIGKDLNTVNLEKTGYGQMIYDMELKYYLPNETIKPIEKGFQITRNYYDFESNSKTPTKDFKSGKIYRGELNVIVPENMYYTVVEERLPAGFEAVNFNLDTADTSLQSKLNKQTVKVVDNYWYDNPLWYFNHKETRDDRVLLFADYLPKGVYTYSFLVRAGLPGKYNHLPASAYQMYFPEVFGRTEGNYVEIK